MLYCCKLLEVWVDLDMLVWIQMFINFGFEWLIFSWFIVVNFGSFVLIGWVNVLVEYIVIFLNFVLIKGWCKVICKLCDLFLNWLLQVMLIWFKLFFYCLLVWLYYVMYYLYNCVYFVDEDFCVVVLGNCGLFVDLCYLLNVVIKCEWMDEVVILIVDNSILCYKLDWCKVNCGKYWL